MPETLRITSQGESLEALYYPGNGPLVLFCHGFPGVYKHYDLAENLSERGLSTLVLKYRGVDGSNGLFNFLSAIEDVTSVVDYIKDQGISLDGIGLFGYSIGAYYGLNVAAERPQIKSVCALSPISDLPKAARTGFENIYQLMIDAQDLIKTRGVHDLVASFAEIWRDYNLPACVRTIKNLPLLVVESTANEMGSEQAQILYDAANEPKQIKWLSGSGHYFDSPAVRVELSDLIADFFKKTLIN